jgi:ABC-type nitrate/sulfonate/bicarbonate transport system permease component
VQRGLGYTMLIQRTYLNTPGILVIVIIYALLAIIFDYLVRTTGSRITGWTERESVSFDRL